MPTTESLSVKQGETLNLEKGYYHGVVFDIPGAEVLINGEWTPYNANNVALIKAQNPMTLEWRLNADLLRKLGYKQGDTLSGTILVVDDQWNGLNITKDFSVSLEADGPNAVSAPLLDSSDKTWHTVDGHRFDTKPTKPGVYVLRSAEGRLQGKNGQKVIVK